MVEYVPNKVTCHTMYNSILEFSYSNEEICAHLLYIYVFSFKNSSNVSNMTVIWGNFAVLSFVYHR
jgi:hypothetical protein